MARPLGSTWSSVQYKGVLSASKNMTNPQYIRVKGQDDAFYKQMVIDYLERFGSASREDMDALLITKLGDGLSVEEKETMVGNLLTSLSRAGRIRNAGSRKVPSWMITEKVQNKSTDPAE